RVGRLDGDPVELQAEGAERGRLDAPVHVPEHAPRRRELRFRRRFGEVYQNLDHLLHLSGSEHPRQGRDHLLGFVLTSSRPTARTPGHGIAIRAVRAWRVRSMTRPTTTGRRRLVALLAAAVGLIDSACGPAGPEMAPVAGKVTYNGKPLT